MNEEQVRKTIAKNLKRLLYEHDKTQADIARDLNINKGTVSSWFTGARIPRMDKVDALCQYLRCTRADILEDTKSKNIIRLQRPPADSPLSFRSQLLYVYGNDTAMVIDAYVNADDITRQLVKRALGSFSFCVHPKCAS